MWKRIEKLTPQQQAMMPVWRDRCIELGLRTGESDWDRFERGIRVAYEKANIPFPERIVRVPSPIVGAFTASIVNSILRSGAVGNAVHGAVHGAVGNAVQGSVSDAVGDAVRSAVDNAIHSAVHGAVRNAVHRAVHSAVHSAVRDVVVGDVRDAVDNAIHSAVVDAVDNAVRGAVHGAVGDAVRSAVGNAVYGAVHGAVYGAVRGAICISVHNAIVRSVEGAVNNTVANVVNDAVAVEVSNEVSNAVSGAVADALKNQALQWHNWFGGQFWIGGWCGSPAYVSFFTDVCGLELEPDIAERAQACRDICESVNYVWPNRNFVMVSERPTAIRRDNEGRLSSDQKMAIEYPDGWGLYALSGVVLEYDLWKRIVSQEMTLDEIMKIENADHQAVALMYNPNAILSSGAVLIDGPTKRGNELFKLTDTELNEITGFDEMYFVRMKCPTGRVFIEDAEPEYAKATMSADACQAFNCHLTPEQYAAMRAEG